MLRNDEWNIGRWRDASIINSNGLENLEIIKEKYFEYDTNIFKEFRNLKKR